MLANDTTLSIHTMTRAMGMWTYLQRRFRPGHPNVRQNSVRWTSGSIRKFVKLKGCSIQKAHAPARLFGQYGCSCVCMMSVQYTSDHDGEGMREGGRKGATSISWHAGGNNASTASSDAQSPVLICALAQVPSDQFPPPASCETRVASGKQRVRLLGREQELRKPPSFLLVPPAHRVTVTS